MSLIVLQHMSDCEQKFLKTDEQAIKVLPQFLRQAMTVPDSRIKELHESRPSNYTAPESPQTKKYEL